VTRRYRDLLLGLLLTALPCLATSGLSAMQAPDPVHQRHGVLAEPLVAFDAPTSAERQALTSAPAEYAAGGEPARIEALSRYLGQAQDSP